MTYQPPGHLPSVAWRDGPSGGTPLDAALLNASTTDLISYVQAVIVNYDAYIASTYATLDSPAFINNPTTANNPPGTSDNSIASMNDVQTAIQAAFAGGGGTGAPANLSPPVISSLSPQSGDVLLVTGDVWTTTLTAKAYQWRNSPDGVTWTNISAGGSGFASSAYTVQSADIGKLLDVTMTATNAVPATSAVIVSAPTTAVTSSVVAAPVAVGAPTVTGSVVQGSTLTAVPTTFTGTGPITSTYLWKRLAPGQIGAGTPITGATALTYVLTGADVGNTVYFAQTGTNAGGSTPAFSTPATGPIIASGGGGGGGTVLWSPTFTLGQAPIKGSSAEWATTGTNYIFTDSTGTDVLVTCVADPLGSGTPVYKFFVAEKDKTSTAKPRADLLAGTGIVEGSSVFVSAPFYLPVGVAGVNVGIPVFGGGGSNFCQFLECKDTIGGPPMWGFYIQGIGGVQSYVLRNGATGAVYWSTPVNNGWHTPTLSGVWSRSASTGFFNLWWDGVAQTFPSTGTQTLNVATLGSSSPQVGSGPQPLDLNSYRASGFYTGTLTTYHGRPKIGTTLSSTLPDSGNWSGP